MSHSTLITDYLGTGTAASRPVAPNLPTGCLGVWLASDTGEASLWNGSTWQDIASVNTIVSGNGIAQTGSIFGTGTVSVKLGAGLSFSSGSIVAAVPSLTAGAGIASVTSGTIVANYQAAAVTALGTGLSNTSGTLSASASSLTAGAGIVSVTSGTIVANYQGTTVTSLGTGLANVAGALTPNWRAGTVTSVSTGLDLTAGVLTATGVASLTAGAGITSVTSGTIVANWNGGTVAALAANQLVISSTTLGIKTGPTIQVVQGTSLMVVNSNTSTAFPATATTSSSLIVGADNLSAGPEVIAVAGTVTGTVGASLLIGGRINGSLASPSPLSTDDRIMGIAIRGYETAYSAARVIWTANAGSTWTGSNWENYQVFSTVPNGSTTATERMRLLSGGALLIGTTVAVGSEKLRVVGDVNTSGTETVGGIIINGGSVITAIGSGLTNTSGTLSAAAGSSALTPNIQTASYSVLATDVGKLVIANATTATTLTVPALATIGSNNVLEFTNINTGFVTVTVGGSNGTIDAAGTTFFLGKGQFARLTNNGTNWFTEGPGGFLLTSGGGGVAVCGTAHVMSGAVGNAFIGGGGTNTASGGNSGILAGASNSVSATNGQAIGATNTIGASANSSVLVGTSNTNNSSSTSMILGLSNTASSGNSVIVGILNNGGTGQSVLVGRSLTSTSGNNYALGETITMTGSSATSLGFQGNDRGNARALIRAFGGPGTTVGPSQTEDHMLWNTNHGTISVTLTTDGAAGSSANVASIGTKTSGLFWGSFIISDQANGNANTYYMATPGVITKGTSAATTVVSGVTILPGPTLGSGLILQAIPAITADTTNGGLAITYQPPLLNTDTIFAQAHIILDVMKGQA